LLFRPAFFVYRGSPSSGGQDAGTPEMREMRPETALGLIVAMRFAMIQFNKGIRLHG
jgi:hypothetical protein